MKALFLVFHGFEPHNGISKKIRSQVCALRSMGVDTYLCYNSFDDKGNGVRYIDGQILDHFGSGFFSKLAKRFSYGRLFRYIKENKIDLVYVRSNFNANPFLMAFFKKIHKNGVKIAMEIPTYPYDGEFANTSKTDRITLFIDKIFRKAMATYIDRIVTFTNLPEVFGRPAISISNGIDFDSIQVKKELRPVADEFNMISVSEVHLWHGLDRVVEGLALYYKEYTRPLVYFHVVGRGFGREFNDLQMLVKERGLTDKVIFYGNKSGAELDAVFEKCDFGIASLARHRSGIVKIKTLKNREYAARGIPFVYSEIDDDFEGKPYVLKAVPDETPLDIDAVLAFYKGLEITPSEIRASIEPALSWKVQMGKVLSGMGYNAMEAN